MLQQNNQLATYYRLCATSIYYRPIQPFKDNNLSSKPTVQNVRPPLLFGKEYKLSPPAMTAGRAQTISPI